MTHLLIREESHDAFPHERCGEAASGWCLDAVGLNDDGCVDYCEYHASDSPETLTSCLLTEAHSMSDAFIDVKIDNIVLGWMSLVCTKQCLHGLNVNEGDALMEMI